jgi:tetratricopeptide (TPR) repeat protein
MKYPSKSHARRLFLLAVGPVLAACAGGLPDVEPVDIPRLEQEVAATPENTDLQVQLGMAQYKATDYEAARTSLQTAIDAGNESGPAFLYLGLVQEELQDWSAAREAYNEYLTVAASSAAREEVRKRLTMIGRNLLRAQAQQALAQEQEITATNQITPQSVAVLPLAFNSDRDDLEPLIYALSDMMITDFKVSNALIVLERAQIQTLLDEMALTSAGYAEAGTGARAGRLLRAEHVFQGVLTTLGENDLQTDADILNVPSTSSAGQLTEAAVLEQLFDMEKQIVIRTIREILGVELTPAEEQAILDNRMENVLAFLAYGRGLRELDQGNYEAAQAEFDLAVSLEPSAFQGTDIAMAELAALTDAASSSTSDIAGIASATGETGTSMLAPPTASTTTSLDGLGLGGSPVGAGSTDGQTTTLGLTINTLKNLSESIDPTPTAGTIDLGSSNTGGDQATEATRDTTRDPVQEVSGKETLSNTAQAQIRIVIRRPGSGE